MIQGTFASLESSSMLASAGQLPRRAYEDVSSRCMPHMHDKLKRDTNVQVYV